MNTYLLALLLVSAALAEEQPFKKVIHNTDPNARCLDGSPPALYIHQGTDPDNFIVFFNGGGICTGNSLSQTLQSCYQRSKTDLGSSKNLKDEIIVNGGYLSTDPQKSKFATWTKVIIEYCDGALHQGKSNNSIRYKDAQLFFRGADNTRSHFKYLIDKHNFKSAKQVVLTGSSAGGIATYLWNNYVRSLLDNPMVMSSIPDSAIFISTASPQSGQYIMEIQTKSLFKLVNVNELTPNGLCNRFKAGEQYKCFFIQVIFTSLDGRFLLINSQYDPQAIINHLQIPCPTKGVSGMTLSNCNSNQLANIEVYRKLYLNFITNFLHFSKNSVWTISCSEHVYAVWSQFYDVPEQKVPATTGLTVRNAIQKFVFQGQRITSVDQVSWPNNSPCAN